MDYKQIERPRVVCQRLGIAIATLYDWCAPSSPRFDPDFPQKIKIGRRAVGFDSSEITEWLSKRAQRTLSQEAA